jgi:hypothetical protein
LAIHKIDEKLQNFLSDIREELVTAAINRAITSINYDIYDDFHKNDMNLKN